MDGRRLTTVVLTAVACMAATAGTASAGRRTTAVVTSLAQLQAAADQAQPGDRIELADRVYSATKAITIRRSGTVSAPITIAAQHVGKAEIKGSAGFAFGAVSHVAVEGFRLTHGGGVNITAHHIRFARNTVQLAGGGNWVTVVGNDIEVDHNTFQNKSTEGVFLQTSGPGEHGMAQRTRIHHNYFHNHTFGGSNGGESIRHGYSFRQLSSAFGVIEYNLFERANGDSEAISVKSSDNIVRFNTLRNSRGSIVLRHGNRNLVEGNFMLGNTAGIRLYENDHVIVNNLIQGGTGQLIIGSGTIRDDTNWGKEHAATDRALVAFNTVTGSRTPLLTVGTDNKTYPADSCTFANNLLVGPGSGALVDVGKATNLRWQGNIIWGGSRGDMPSTGGRSANPALVTDAGGLRRLSSPSPAIDAAIGTYPQASRDMDLTSRVDPKDVGADEYGAAQRRPLTTADVGPGAP